VGEQGDAAFQKSALTPAVRARYAAIKSIAALAPSRIIFSIESRHHWGSQCLRLLPWLIAGRPQLQRIMLQTTLTRKRQARAEADALAAHEAPARW